MTTKKGNIVDQTNKKISTIASALHQCNSTKILKLSCKAHSPKNHHPC